MQSETNICWHKKSYTIFNVRTHTCVIVWASVSLCMHVRIFIRQPVETTDINCYFSICGISWWRHAVFLIHIASPSTCNERRRLRDWYINIFTFFPFHNFSYFYMFISFNCSYAFYCALLQSPYILFSHDLNIECFVFFRFSLLFFLK